MFYIKVALVALVVDVSTAVSCVIETSGVRCIFFILLLNNIVEVFQLVCNGFVGSTSTQEMLCNLGPVGYTREITGTRSIMRF